MDLSKIIQMVINLVLRKVINRGVDAGINYASKRGKTDDQMTPEDLQQAKSAKEMAKRAKQAINVGRKIGR